MSVGYVFSFSSGFLVLLTNLVETFVILISVFFNCLSAMFFLFRSVFSSFYNLGRNSFNFDLAICGYYGCNYQGITKCYIIFSG